MPSGMSVSLIFLLFLASLCSTKGVTVVQFQGSGESTAKTYLRYLKRIPTMDRFSVCFRLRITQARSLNSILSYSLDDFENELYIAVDVKRQLLEVSCCLNRFLSSTPIIVKLHYWLSFCLTLDLRRKFYILVQDGRSLKLIDKSRAAKEIGTQLNGTGELYFGQDQDANDGKFNPFRSYSGELGDFFMFDETLTEREMIEFTLCEIKIRRPSVVNLFNVTGDFEVQNVSVFDHPEVNFCDPIKSFYKIFGERKNFFKTTQFCHSLGGNLVQPESRRENSQLFKVSSTSFLCKQTTTYYNDALWLGVVVDKNDSWVNYITGEKANYTNFAPTERKSLQEFNCVTLYACASDSYKWHAKWLMRKCTDRRKTVCKFDNIPVLRLRGLCRKSFFDRRYILTPDSPRNIFSGYAYSRILPTEPTENNTHGDWIIERKDRPELKAKFQRLSVLHYPMGRNMWHIENDVCNVPIAELKLTVCTDGQFSCNDGTCIDLSNRCDLLFNCKDKSDEDDCNPLVLPPTYSRDIPPPTPEGKEINEISLLVHIQNILHINVETFQIGLEMYVRSSWLDQRLNFKNLRASRKDNNAEDIKHLIWTPDFAFQGPSNASCDITERKSTFSLKRLSKPLPDNDENIGEDLIYPGESNPLVWELKNTVLSYCQFDLVEYPFDTQTCELDIIMKELSTGHFKLVFEKNGIEYFGPTRLLEYEVKNITMIHHKDKLYSTVRLVFRNLVSYYIANTFLPTFLMLVIGYLTFYFPIEEFNERVMVSITALLVESSFFSEVNATIPKTVYVKKIDVWCIFCIIVLFLITGALTIVNYLKKLGTPKFNINLRHFLKVTKRVESAKSFTPTTVFFNKKPQGEDDLSEKFNIGCRIVFPFCVMTFIAWYLGSSLYVYDVFTESLNSE